MPGIASDPVREHAGVTTVCSGGASIQGSRRDQNEDSWSLDADGQVFVVADGMGGCHDGVIVSRIACEFLSHELEEFVHHRRSAEEFGFPFANNLGEDVLHALADAMQAADAAIVSEKKVRVGFHDMGTTAIVAVIVEEQLSLASIGNSRAYLVRDGQAQQLTQDHTIAAGFVAAGLLTPEQARTHQYRNVLYKYLGAGANGDSADIASIRISSGDRLVLCTDGVSNCVSAAEIVAVCEQCQEPEHAAAELVGYALGHGSHDDATCVVLFLE